MRKLFFGLVVVAIATLGVCKINDGKSRNTKSDLQIENLELLAEGIEGTFNPCDRGAIRWDPPSFWDDDLCFYLCEDCALVRGRNPVIVQCNGYFMH